MRLRYFWALVPLLFFFEGARANCRLDAAVYFANGMFNEYSDANESLSVLRKIIRDESPKKAARVQKWKIAYNTNEPVLKQIWQVFDEKRNEVKGNFWSSIFDLLGHSEWARRETTSILKKISKEEILKDADLRKQLLDYVGDLKHGYSIITFAHSQGNFYSLFAFDRLSDYSEKLHLISVATPAGRTLSHGYVTLESDGVITSIPGALPPNVRKSDPGLFDHKFIEDYIGSSEPLKYMLEEFERSFGSERPRDASLLADGIFDESLDPVLDWFREYFRKPTALEIHKCLLFWVLVDLYNVNDSDEFGCKDRNLAAAEESLDDCMKDISSNGGGQTSCPFAGMGAAAGWGWGAWGILSTREIKVFRETNPKCNWQVISDIESDLGVDGIKRTKQFLKSIVEKSAKSAETKSGRDNTL